MSLVQSDEQPTPSALGTLRSQPTTAFTWTTDGTHLPIHKRQCQRVLQRDDVATLRALTASFAPPFHTWPPSATRHAPSAPSPCLLAERQIKPGLVRTTGTGEGARTVQIALSLHPPQPPGPSRAHSYSSSYQTTQAASSASTCLNSQPYRGLTASAHPYQVEMLGESIPASASTAPQGARINTLRWFVTNSIMLAE
jgi:hypothetical protein